MQIFVKGKFQRFSSNQLTTESLPRIRGRASVRRRVQKLQFNDDGETDKSGTDKIQQKVKHVCQFYLPLISILCKDIKNLKRESSQ